MPDRDIVLAKTASVQKCLRRIREVTQLQPASLDEMNIQDIFVLNLQRAVQATIDLSVHIVASEGLGLADSVKGNFVLLENAGIINRELSEKMQSMVGFRNIAIHDYKELDLNILKTILQNNLKDLENLYTQILSYFKIV
jgi:uncharacterized protein YutE (UPF0331/DUF86 family)